MAACQIPGHSDTYGLGIRISFYLQWFAMIIMCWVSESDALNFKFLNGLTILATSIGLVLKIEVLQPAEIHVVLLILCGTLYFLIPVFLWRALTCCRPWWDPQRWTRMRLGWLFRTAMAIMFGILLGLQIWFWSSGVYIRPPGTDTSCQQYGFLLGQLPLDSPALTAVNVIIHIAMLTVGIWLFCSWIGMFGGCRRKKRKWRISQNRIESLQQFSTISDVIVAAIVTTAIELVIAWNNISGVNNLDTAAQLIPPIIGAAYFLHSIYVWMSESPSEDSSYVDVSSWDGISASYTHANDGANRAYIPSRAVYEDPSYVWAGQTRHPHRHRRHRRSTATDYGAGQPEMSTAYPPAQGHAAGNIVEPEPIHENA